MSENDQAPVDVEGFRESMREAGIEEVVDTMLELFLGELPERLGEIRTARDAGDLPALASAAHALKSSSGNIRAQLLFEHVRDLERGAKDEHPDAVGALTEAVLDEAERVEGYLVALA